MGTVFKPISRLEQLAYATVRIENELGYGTGFLLQKNIDKKTMLPLLITNKHVVYSEKKKEINGRSFIEKTLAKHGKLIFHISDGEGNPIDFFASCEYESQFGASFIPHPNPDVDLCALNLASYINALHAQKQQIFVRYIPLTLIPTEEELKNLDYMEDLIMIGYPRALADESHNYPIIRKGVSATHPYIDFNGKKEFLADIANFPGSSGSPVFLLKNNYTDKLGNTQLGSGLFYFMGIAYAGPTCPIIGDMKIFDVPTKLEAFQNFSMMMNLAYVIKASELNELVNIVESNILTSN